MYSLVYMLDSIQWLNGIKHLVKIEQISLIEARIEIIDPLIFFPSFHIFLIFSIFTRILKSQEPSLGDLFGLIIYIFKNR